MAKNSISKISNAFSTGGGGVNFEQQIQAMFLLSLLIDGFCPAMNEQTKKVHFQAKHLGHDVDDLVVITYRNQSEGKMACQIKHSITATEKDKTFQEVICAAWNDFNKEDFDRDRDRISLVTAQISNKAQQSLRFLHVEAIGAIEKVIEFISKKLASGKRIHELELLKRTLQYHHGIIGRLRKRLSETYQCEMDEHCTENVINMMTNEFPTSAAKKTYAQCVFLKKEQDDYGISDVYGKMLENPEFCAILEELVDFGISRYKVNYSYHYQDTNLVLYQKYTYEDACRLLNWERNEVPLNIGGYKYDKKTKTFPIFINYDKQDNISDTTKYEDHFVAENRLIAISKSGRSMDSEDVQNFLNATERGIDVQLFVRKNKDDKISKEFYYLGRVIATGNAKQFVMPNTDKTAVEIEWELETPVREDIYQYIVNE